MKKIIMGTLLILLISACGDKKGKKDEYPLDVSTKVVKYSVVEKKSDASERDFSGKIITEVLSNLSFRVGGTIQERYADLGDYVQKGQLLAKLDPTDYQLQYNQSYAEMEKSRANYVNAQSNFKRDTILYIENSISLAQYQSSQASYEAAKSALEAAKSSTEYQKKQLGYTNLYAPADGTISQVNKQVGESVSSETTVFTLNVTGNLEILFNVSEAAVSQIKIGENMKFKVDALQNIPLEAVITNIGTASTGYGNTYPVKAKIINSPKELRVGMTITATLNVSPYYKQAEKIIIPAEAVMVDPENKKYVFTIKNIENGYGTVQKTYVNLGVPVTEGVEVNEGLTEGEYIVTDGYNQIAEGEKVELKERGE